MNKYGAKQWHANSRQKGEMYNYSTWCHDP